MKLQFWSVGKNNEPYVKMGVEDFTKRISNYYKVEWNIIPVPKNAGMMSELDLKKKEGEIPSPVAGTVMGISHDCGFGCWFVEIGDHRCLCFRLSKIKYPRTMTNDQTSCSD